MAKVDDERLLTQFLLGDVAPGDRSAIEARLVEDPAFFDALCALEDEIILKWHRGELADDEGRLFTQSLLAVPARQARVASVRELIDASKRWKQRAETPSTFWNLALGWLSRPYQLPRYGLAAAVALLVVAVPLAMYEMGRLRRAEPEDAAAQVGTARHRAVVFTLPPVTERGRGDAGTNVVRIPRDASEISLTFETTDPGTAVGFDAILQPMERAIAATTRPARVERTAAGALVTLTMAATDLPDDDYVLRLRRITTAESPEIVATRTFRVTRE